MKLFQAVVLILLLINLGVSACTGSPTDASPDTESPIIPLKSEQNQPTSTLLPSTTGEKSTQSEDARNVPDEIVEKAKMDLAEHLGIALDQIHTSDTQAVTWPDTSLGCPQPGMAYAQMLIPGYLVRFESQGQIYEYHSDMVQTIIQCNAIFDEKNPNINEDSVDDGWPNETKDNDVIITTPMK